MNDEEDDDNDDKTMTLFVSLYTLILSVCLSTAEMYTGQVNSRVE